MELRPEQGEALSLKLGAIQPAGKGEPQYQRRAAGRRCSGCPSRATTSPPSAIGAITPAGKLFLHVRERALRGPDVDRFLRHLLDCLPGGLLVLWDGSPIHRARAVLAFLAAGAAARLVTTVRTAENHVQRLLTKLESDSRTRLALWVRVTSPGRVHGAAGATARPPGGPRVRVDGRPWRAYAVARGVVGR